jgi:hypothetical protein
MDNFPEITGVNFKSIRYALSALKYLTIRNGKLLRSGKRVTIECGTALGVSWSFKCTIGDGVVNVDDGLRCVIGSDDPAWETVETEPIEYEGDGVIYMTRIYPVLDTDGNVATPGSWVGPAFASVLPDNTQFQFTKIIARITGGALVHEHFGNIEVFDVVRCSF